MQDGYDWPGFVYDTPEEIANSAIELYQDEKVWLEKQQNGITIVNNIFNKTENEKIFITKLVSVISSLEENRKNNFTGMMLRHHTMKSSMYMSQWIEAKNKLVQRE